MKKFLYFSLVFALSQGVQNLNAQDFDDILAAGVDDANTYLENYMAPAVNSFGNGMAGGWYNTARPHKLFGVDATFSLNMSAIPDNELKFNFDDAGFQNLQLENQPDRMVPTLVGGPRDSNSELIVPANTPIGNSGVAINQEVSFDTPSGFNLEDAPIITGVPTPTLNLGIGLIKNTDLKIRFVPEQSFDNYSVKMFGVGVLHDVKQWIPGIKNLPFDLAGFIGTTKLTSDYDVSVAIEENNGTSSTTFTGDGTANFITNATTIQGIISKKLAVFTPYASLGFNFVKTRLDVKGDYVFEVDPNVALPEDEETVPITDPIDLEFTGAGGARLTVGARVKLLVFTIHGSYTVQKYNNVTLGIGLSIR